MLSKPISRPGGWLESGKWLPCRHLWFPALHRVLPINTYGVTDQLAAAQKRTPEIADTVCQSGKKPNGIKGCAGAYVSV
jgi:hypothetical protein